MRSRRNHRAVFVVLAIAGVFGGCARRPQIRQVSSPPAAAAYEWRLPPGLPAPIVPPDNPMSQAKVDLGRRLFYDTRISGDGGYACASCHEQARAFTDGLARAIGATGQAHAHSAMSLTNIAYNASFGWADPARHTLEAQIAVPMFNEHPIEMGLTGKENLAVARLAADAATVGRFRAAFPGDVSPVSFANVVKALASFERTLTSGDSPFDRYLYRDDRAAMSEAALRGMTLFFSNKTHCSECHAGFNLSGAVAFADGPAPLLEFHNTGLYNVDGRGSYPAEDRGLIEVTNRAGDMGRFRAPTLRNIAVTAPYMHDGSLPTLDIVISHYASGGVNGPHKSDRLSGFPMSNAEELDLIAFLESLTDNTFLTNPAFADPGR